MQRSENSLFLFLPHCLYIITKCLILPQSIPELHICVRKDRLSEVLVFRVVAELDRMDILASKF
jgi:hypothetical protein